MNPLLRVHAFVCLAATLAGCASQGKPPPTISLDEPVQAQSLPEPPKPVEVVAVPQPLPLPDQLKPLPAAVSAAVPAPSDTPVPELADERLRVSRANEEARMAPTREGFVNAIQVWPFSDGALYQVYASPGRVTAISLQQGEELVTVAAGDSECRVRSVSGRPGLDRGTNKRPHCCTEPAGSERSVSGQGRLYGSTEFRLFADAHFTVPGDGRDRDRGGAGDRHQVRPTG